MLVGFVVSLIAASMMYIALHDQTSSAHDRSWGQALHTAESGVNDAIGVLQNTGGVAPSGVVHGTTDVGSYEYQITALARNRYQIDAVGTVGNSAGLSSARRLRVTLAPPPSFSYGLFSLSDVAMKNNNTVCGDVWSNTSVVVDNGDAVRAATSSNCPSGSMGTGNVTAATGSIQIVANSSVEGNAWAGGYESSGYGISVGKGSTISGSATASSSTPACADDPTSLKYKIGPDGTISGSATAWGAITAGVLGTRRATTCTTGSPTQSIPTFTYNAANYPAGTVHEYNFPSDYVAFKTYIAANKTNLSGTFYLAGGGAAYPIDLGGVTVTGDLAIFAEASPIDASGGIDAAGSNDKTVVLATWFTGPASSCTTGSGNPADCAIGIKNNFDMQSGNLSAGDNTAVLLYAPNGPIAFKNNAEFHGAVYANNIQINNNMKLATDPRVASIVGFGATTLDISLWLECSSGPVTTTAC
jgi:hypothetical protein